MAGLMTEFHTVCIQADHISGEKKTIDVLVYLPCAGRNLGKLRRIAFGADVDEGLIT